QCISVLKGANIACRRQVSIARPRESQTNQMLQDCILNVNLSVVHENQDIKSHASEIFRTTQRVQRKEA
ncbi:MAG: hypothetical protein ACK424_06775, partial [Candidatus Thermochlorobacter sp.]